MPHGRALGCIEALMCLGDRPERAFRVLPRRRCACSATPTRSRIYVAACCAIALDEGLLPHTNAGLLTRDEMTRLRPLNAAWA